MCLYEMVTSNNLIVLKNQANTIARGIEVRYLPNMVIGKLARKASGDYLGRSWKAVKSPGSQVSCRTKSGVNKAKNLDRV